ncbi:hypothetical protein ACFY2T_41365 [Streptomyces sp. NPDC001260]|uniref:hypothetical protein n=1 Tax=Streptomyces sp. NPDC001260 TaxID=3364551 RepID=UPI003689C0BE
METSRYFRNPDGTVVKLSAVNLTPSAPETDGVEEITVEEYEAAMAAYAEARQKELEEATAEAKEAAKSAYLLLSAVPGITAETAAYLARYTPQPGDGPLIAGNS